MKSTYKCRRNGKHIFTKESNKEREICSQCHGFADKIKETNEDNIDQDILTKSIIAEVASTLIDDSVDYSSTDVSSETSSSSDDFSGNGGDFGGGGASGEW